MRKALCIGIKDYDHISPLNNPVNDAESICLKLEELGFETTLLKNIDRTNFLREYDDFLEAASSANVTLVYFAGHGIQSNGINYLIPRDADIRRQSDLDHFCIRLDKIVFQDKPNLEQVSLVILDACRNDPFSKIWNRSIGNSGFAPILAPSGTLISFSTSPGQTASDGYGKNGLFTSKLIVEITKPDLSIIQIFQNVRQKVLYDSNNQQLPWESTSLLGDFYLNSYSFNSSDIRVLRLKEKISKLNEKTYEYRITEIEAMDESTEGGVIYKYENNNEIIRLEKRLYFETGRYFQNIYFFKNLPIYYQISNHNYNVPIYVDENIADELNSEVFDDKKTRISVEDVSFP